jgi:hypothetical protein
MRLLQANMRDDVAALDEASKILGDLRGAWAKIGPAVRAASEAGAGAASGGARATTVPPAQRALSAYQG